MGNETMVDVIMLTKEDYDKAAKRMLAYLCDKSAGEDGIGMLLPLVGALVAAQMRDELFKRKEEEE